MSMFRQVIALKTFPAILSLGAPRERPITERYTTKGNVSVFRKVGGTGGPSCIPFGSTAAAVVSWTRVLLRRVGLHTRHRAFFSHPQSFSLDLGAFVFLC